MAEAGIYSINKKGGKGTDVNGYSVKLHRSKHGETQGGTGAKNATVAEGDAAKHQTQKNLMKKEIQKQAFKERARETANASGGFMKRFVDKAEDILKGSKTKEIALEQMKLLATLHLAF